VTRVVELDKLRGVAVGLMIVVHVLAFFAAPEVQTHGSVHVLMQLGKLTAVFVICMGFATTFSRRQSLREALVRAAGLLAAGYLLNAAKFLVPLLVLGNFPAGLELDLGLVPGENAIFFLLLGDVLHMSALSLAAISVLRHLGARPWAIFALALAVAAGGPLLWGRHTGEPVSDYVLALVAADDWQVFFPLFPWLAYALLGMGLGELWRTSELPRPQLYRRWFVVGAGLALAGLVLGQIFPTLWTGADFYRSGPAAVICVGGVALMLFLVAHHVPVPSFVFFFSRHVTSLYVLSWLVITWTVGSLGFMQFSRPGPLFVLVLAVLATSLAAQWLLTTTMARRRKPAATRS
jgi:uncharacterized membrane protein